MASAAASVRLVSNFRRFSGLSRAATISYTSICRPQNHSISTTSRNFSQPTPRAEKAKVTINYVMRDGSKVPVQSKIGENLLDIAIENDLDIDGFGACEGTLACSTCHLVFEQEVYDQLEEPTDEELDMLDLAFGLTDTSRLGCQVCVTKALDGLTVKVPEGVADARDV